MCIKKPQVSWQLKAAGNWLYCLVIKKLVTRLPVAMRLGETPVPIPNTMVKTQEADGTMLETAWESRWLPDSFKKIQTDDVCYIYRGL